ncbi:MAG: magnesium transporter [Armatimonadota bacterium]|nr:magnesium transporter [Armatimonadota bacterium]MDR7420849.1 magnesium transporter [Armatimonadota bacterium]MDR7453700.1 magnesium transporter [Armatimonadota bacterium]MDR7457682.1 magnesium transporter [Armatimonadota bacterium]MDR7495585.1 magnesium transporter [Armatimonadota bacterium]
MDAEALARAVRDRLDGRDLPGMAQLLRPQRPAELVDLIRHLDPPDAAAVLVVLPDADAAEVLAGLSAEEQGLIAASLADERLAALLGEMASDEATDLLGELPEERARRLLALLPPPEATAVSRLLAYPERSAGGLMSAEWLAVSPEATAAETIDALRQRGREIDLVYYVYVVEADRLVGVVTLRDLIVSPPTRRIREFMRTRLVTAGPLDDQETVAALARKYALLAVPVVDGSGRLLGIVTADDLVKVVKSEATEDVLRFSGAVAGTETRARPFPWGVVGRRVAFLVLNLHLNIVAALLISRFEATLRAAVALAFFVPALVATAGNVGTQSLALTVRGLATRRFDGGSWGPALRETYTGALVGAVCGLAVGAFAAVWQRDLGLGFVVGAAMWIALIVAAPIGMLIPIGMERLGVDPAIASGPLTTTVTDNTTLLVYLLMASAFIHTLAR